VQYVNNPILILILTAQIGAKIVQQWEQWECTEKAEERLKARLFEFIEDSARMLGDWAVLSFMCTPSWIYNLSCVEIISLNAFSGNIIPIE
jgi:hypothetical protein